MPWSEAELAYMAGMVDGEGTVSAFLYKNRMVLRLAVYNSHRGVLDWIALRFSGKVRKVSRKRDNWKDAYTWESGYQAAASVLRQILPYLIIKKRQAELFIQLAESNSRVTHCGGRKRVPEDLKELRIELATQITMMNKLGVENALVTERRDKTH